RLQVFKRILQVGLLQLLDDLLIVEDGLRLGMVDDLADGRLRGQQVLELGVVGDVLKFLALCQRQKRRVRRKPVVQQRVVINQTENIRSQIIVFRSGIQRRNRFL